MMPSRIYMCRGSRAFTLVELLVVVAIIAVLVAMLVPSLGNAREHAYSAVCRSNLSQLWRALASRSPDSSSYKLPEAKDWVTHVVNAGATTALTCPKDPDVVKPEELDDPPVSLPAVAISYGMNNQVDRLALRPEQLLLLEYHKHVADFDELGVDDLDFDKLVAPRHLGRLNTLHVTGDVRSYWPDEVDPDTDAGRDAWRP